MIQIYISLQFPPKWPGGTKIGEQVTKQPSPLQLEKYLC